MLRMTVNSINAARPAQCAKALLSSDYGIAARYFSALRFFFYAYFFPEETV